MDERFFEMGFTMIHDEQDSFLRKPVMNKAVHPNPTDTYPPKHYTYHRKEKCVYQDKSWNQNSLVRESIREIEETNHYEKCDKD